MSHDHTGWAHGADRCAGAWGWPSGAEETLDERRSEEAEMNLGKRLYLPDQAWDRVSGRVSGRELDRVRVSDRVSGRVDPRGWDRVGDLLREALKEEARRLK